jgi:hypothetical protein
MEIADIESLDHEITAQKAKGVVEAERQCRITLATTWPRMVPLEWNPGGTNGRKSVIALYPGQSVVQPLSKAQCWFGPFSLPGEFKHTTDEKRREALKSFYAREKKRYLDRYDYERGTGMGYKPSMTITGPHRSPDVNITIIEADGAEGTPICLHQLYKIGEWDPMKSMFEARETPEQMEERYKAELEVAASRHSEQINALRLQMAEVLGTVKERTGKHG